jgi:ABC-type multidrug transport system ATPase subunit
MYAAELYNVKTDETTDLFVDALIQKTGLMSCADTRIARLSGGQRRRVLSGCTFEAARRPLPGPNLQVALTQRLHLTS